MKWFKNALLVLVTLALAAAGAVMPFTAARWQDQQQAGVEVRSFDSFLLTLKKKGELNQILRFFAENGYYEFLDAAPEEAAMSEQEAVDAAMEVVEVMFKCGLIDRSILNAIKENEAAGVDPPSVYISRITSEPEAQAAYITHGVDWYNPGISISLDDASGKAFQIFANYTAWWQLDEQYDSNTSKTTMSKEDFYARMENWRLFIKEYYDFEVQEIEEIPYSDSRGFWLYVDLEDGGDLIPMRLYLTEDVATLSVDNIE